MKIQVYLNRKLLWIAPLVFTAVFPLFVGGYVVHVAIMCFYYIVLAQSWNLLAGYTGLFSLAHNGFSAIGAYTSALLAIYFNIPIPITIFIGGASAMLISYFIGQITLKMGMIYLALTTWAFASGLALVLKFGWKYTRGMLGLSVPYLFGGQRPVYPYYYVSLIFTIISLAVMYKIINSRTGLYLRAIREDEEAAAVMGVGVVKLKRYIFAASGLFAGLAGGVYAHYVGVISPVMSEFHEMSTIIVMVLIGGWGSFIGPLIGASLVEITSEYLRVAGEIRYIVYALLLILVMRFFTGGIAQMFSIHSLKVRFSKILGKGHH